MTWLPFYDDINILRNERTFRGYAENYKVEINNNKNLSDLLSVIKNSIKNLFDELLRKKRSFKYIISVIITPKKTELMIMKLDMLKRIKYR